MKQATRITIERRKAATFQEALEHFGRLQRDPHALFLLGEHIVADPSRRAEALELWDAAAEAGHALALRDAALARVVGPGSTEKAWLDLCRAAEVSHGAFSVLVSHIAFAPPSSGVQSALRATLARLAPRVHDARVVLSYEEALGVWPVADRHTAYLRLERVAFDGNTTAARTACEWILFSSFPDAGFDRALLLLKGCDDADPRVRFLRLLTEVRTRLSNTNPGQPLRPRDDEWTASELSQLRRIAKGNAFAELYLLHVELRDVSRRKGTPPVDAVAALINGVYDALRLDVDCAAAFDTLLETFCQTPFDRIGGLVVNEEVHARFDAIAERTGDVAALEISGHLRHARGGAEAREKAAMAWTRALHAGSETAALRLGDIAREADDVPRAMFLYETALRMGHQGAAKVLALYLIEKGRRSTDAARGLSLLENAYAAGSLSAGFEIAMWRLEKGDIPNPKEAVNLLHALAVAGYPPAMARLGQCFEEGIGCLQSTSMAQHWYSRAESEGYGFTQVLLDPDLVDSHRASRTARTQGKDKGKGKAKGDGTESDNVVEFRKPPRSGERRSS